MSFLPYHSNNSVMPAWVTIDETINSIKRKQMKEFQTVRYGVMRYMGTLRRTVECGSS
ncbi:hypothetical protein [Citrobacter sp. wls615]|uniref:hypothetical protein n=1 Tax=Citrobacter sp. wls615 TaxID=2576435 RepID=UPI0014852A42|nr:hypothetical protein [Citrobacter sp. wls615]